MYNNHNVLAVIPARGNSKRLPRKNIRNCYGKPLVMWTVDVALKTPSIDKVIVSTEDKDIYKLIEKTEAIPTLRPLALSEDHIEATDPVKHVIKLMNFSGYVILLQPTSPLRQVKHINKALKMLDLNSPAVMSVCEDNRKSYLYSYSKEGTNFIPIIPEEKKIYVPNGAIYAAKSDWFLANNTFYTNEVKVFLMDQESSIDIDYDYQLAFAESILEKRNNKEKFLIQKNLNEN